MSKCECTISHLKGGAAQESNYEICVLNRFFFLQKNSRRKKPQAKTIINDLYSKYLV